MKINDAFNLILQKINKWMHEFIQLLPNILLASLILVIGFYLASIIKKFAGKLTNKVSSNKTLNSLFTSVVHIFLLGITLFASLSILHLDKAVTSILAGAGIIGLALAFAFQDIAANFISGIFISFRKPINIDDIVKIKDYMGRVKEINLRDTVLHTFQGQIVIIPNKEVFQNPIENFTLLGKRRFDILVGVSYGDDLEKVKKIALDAVGGIKGLSEDDETTFYYKEFGDSSINFLIRLWVGSVQQSEWRRVGSEAIICIKNAFDENNIMIPFPIRTLDFGIKGGVPLNEIPLYVADKN
ncbi:MAG: mechanosensitive ion channel [Bacteroidia bacterium]|nr:mechanosensitive ion channel [Bacteroidia bacterium]